MGIYSHFLLYSRIISTKSPASGVNIVSAPKVVSQVGRVYKVLCFLQSGGGVGIPTLMYLLQLCD
jgi:hypothetical protein